MWTAGVEDNKGNWTILRPSQVERAEKWARASNGAGPRQKLKVDSSKNTVFCVLNT